MSVVIETTLGDITVDLFVDERPRCCLNFLKLCKVKFYNYCLFHNVQRNFIAQTGDPTGTGRGGESVFRMLYGDQAKYFDSEKVPKIKHTTPGLISMVNDGNGFHGSQFLLTLGENLDSLDDIHTVFGEVAEGMDVVLKINEAFCDKDNRPYQDIRITHTVVLDDPLDDPPGLEIPDKSPEPTQEQLDGCFRIAADEAINDDEGLDLEVVREREATKEASHSAQVLEIIGDIPDKDVRPPDNVLFVCKLNSITTDEDLEIIFARFGTILSCEIIRDYKTGDSLQYAFIEFETPDSCEKAYKKMDNVLIDDRRIHVDFSQSVSKLNFPQGRVTKSDLQNAAQEKEDTSNERPPREASPRGKNHQPPPKRRHRDVTPSRKERGDDASRKERRHKPDASPTRRRHRGEQTIRHRGSRSPDRRRRDADRRHRDVTPPRRDSRYYDERRFRNRDSPNEGRGRRNENGDSDVERRNNGGRSKNGSKHRDVTPDRKKIKRKSVSPPPKKKRDSSSSGSDSEEEETRRKSETKKKRKKEKKSKKKKASTSDSSDVTSGDEAEVRCGKHRKRSVSNHKDDVRRRKSHKHRS